jgi:hypothetical protein
VLPIVGSALPATPSSESRDRREASAVSTRPNSPAEERGRPASYRRVTPEEWWRIPLHPVDARHASVQRLVDRQFRGVDDQPLLKRDTARRLRESADQAAGDAGGIELFVSTQAVAGVPLAVSLLVSMLPPGSGATLETMNDVVSGDGEVARDQIEAGPVLRRRRAVAPRSDDGLEVELTRTTVDYWVPLPGGDSCLQLSYSTPLQGAVADALTELFDAVTGSLRWEW